MSIGTAISYVEVLGEAKVKVCVEDRGEDGWEGQVDVNFENIRLMECCDDASKGLFKELVKKSVVPVDWDVEWSAENAEGGDDDDVKVVSGRARHLIRLMNKLICHADLGGDANAGSTVIVSCDHNLRLVSCSNGEGGVGGGEEDFNRLVMEGVVDWSGSAPISDSTSGKSAAALEQCVADDPFEPPISQLREGHLQNLTALYLQMRELMGLALSERERCASQRREMIDGLVKYVFGGDVSEGKKMMDDLEKDPGDVDRGKDVMDKVGRISEVRWGGSSLEARVDSFSAVIARYLLSLAWHFFPTFPCLLIYYILFAELTYCNYFRASPKGSQPIE